MNNYFDQEDNIFNAEQSAISDEGLESIDIQYIIDQIDDQLDNLLSDGKKQNYLKVFEKQIKHASDIDDAQNLKDSVYNSIIKSILDRFNIDMSLDDINPRLAAKEFYKFFVLQYIDNLSYFVEMYMIENKDEIIDALNHMDHINNKKIEGMDLKTSIILNNMSEIFEVIANSHLTFDDFVTYLNKHPDAPSSAKEMTEYIDLIDDIDEVFNSMITPLTSEEEGFSDVYTNIQTYIYEKFSNDIEE